MEEDIKKTSSYNYKCPSCGAPMHYDPATGKLKCDFCENVVDIEKLTSNEEFDFDSNVKTDSTWAKEKQIIRCKNCGAENVLDKKSLSVTCPFCGSNQVVEIDEVPGFKPNRVIPFKITEKVARDNYLNFIKKKFYVSNKIKKADFKITLNGIYMSSWTYDSKTYSTYEARLGEDYTVTVGTGENKHTETRTRWFTVRGDINVLFDDVLVASGKSISQDELASIQPYSTNNSAVFSEEYLSGFSTEHYSIDVKQGFEKAKTIMRNEIQREILSRYHYDHVDYVKINTGYQDTKYKYVLLPIWIGLYKLQNKAYRFLVNGESGKTKGKYPVSAGKIVATVLIILAIIAFIIFMIYKGQSAPIY